MSVKDKALIIARVIILALVLSVVTRCSGSDPFGPYYAPGPFSVSQISTRLAEEHYPVPVYIPKPESRAGEFITTFYDYDNDGTTYLLTAFYPKKTAGQSNRVAKLRTSGLSPAMDGAINDNKVAINWQN